MMLFGNKPVGTEDGPKTSPRQRWHSSPGLVGGTLVAAAALILGVLSFYQTTSAQTNNPAQQPFANSVQQRLDMVELQKETNRLLREQNDLLRSGQLRVVVSQGNP
jgi:hypothetical protein